MEAQFKRYRQVAIVVSSLDRDTADNVLAQMSDEEASAVRRAILSLDEISEEEQSQALAEFMRRGGKAVELQLPGRSSQRGALDNGVELDLRLGSNYEAEGAENPSPTFECLNGVDGTWLAPLICQEHPQTIAVVVSHLSQFEAARLLGALPPAQQSDVIRRLADLDEMDVESLREIETHLTSWLAENLRDRKRRTTGVSNVAAILRAADPLTRSRLVKQLRLSDEQLAEQVKHNGGPDAMSSHPPQTQSHLHTQTGPGSPASHLEADLLVGEVPPTATSPSAKLSLGTTAYGNPKLNHTSPSQQTTPASLEERTRSSATSRSELSVAQSFEELANWTEKSLRTLLRECEPELILLALTGASENVIRRVMEMFPARQAATLKHALKHPGPTRLSDVAGAQEEIVQIAFSLEQAGRLPKRTGRLSMAV